MRGATRRALFILISLWNFNPRPPCGGRRNVGLQGNELVTFQSTPPMRGATYRFIFSISVMIFQSTPPMRGATCLEHLWRVILYISIHAPHAGGDCERLLY